MTDLPLVATVAQVAAYLGWTESKLRNRIQAGTGHPPYSKQGGRIEFRRDDVLRWYRELPVVTESKPAGRKRGQVAKWPRQA